MTCDADTDTRGQRIGGRGLLEPARRFAKAGGEINPKDLTTFTKQSFDEQGRHSGVSYVRLGH